MSAGEIELEVLFSLVLPLAGEFYITMNLA